MSLVSEIKINGGSETTPVRVVKVTFDVVNPNSPPTFYKIAEDTRDFNSLDWIPIDSNSINGVVFELSGNYGDKEVFMAFRENKGEVETHSVSIRFYKQICLISPFWDSPASELGFNAQHKVNKTPIEAKWFPIYDTEGILFGEIKRVKNSNLRTSGKGKQTYGDLGAITDGYLVHSIIAGKTSSIEFDIKIHREGVSLQRNTLYLFSALSSEPHQLNDARVENPYGLFPSMNACSQFQILGDGFGFNPNPINYHGWTTETNPVIRFTVSHQHPDLHAALTALQIETMF